MAILDKQSLVNYLIIKYRDDFNEKISDIKLQKTLYLLYVFWNEKIRSQHIFDTYDEIKEMVEMNFNYDEDLFDATFESSKCGPIDKDVDNWFKNLTNEEFKDIYFDGFKDIDNFITEYIDYLINKMFNTNDFVLIDISYNKY